MSDKAYNQTHLLVFLFIIFCFTKLLLLEHIPLINDEAYALTISRNFSLSYFDHPPLMMWISYFLHFFDITELYYFRIPHITFGVLTSFFLYKITSIIYSKGAGVASAILYFVSPFFFLSGGLFIVPDASLNFSVAGATYIATRLIFNKEDTLYLWVALGIFLSIAFLSKYQSYLFGMTLFIAFFVWRKNLVFSKRFNISLLISIFGFVPVLFWNIENNFDSFSFHGNRSSFDFDLLHIFNSLFAQLFFLLPTTGFLIIRGLIKDRNLFTKHEKFLILLALPTIIIFNTFILLSDNSFAHWSMVGWMLLIPLASNYLISMRSFKLQLIVLKTFTIFVTVFLIAIILIHSKTGFITRSYEDKIPSWDDTRELLDWGLIASTLTDTLQLDSVATLNWYDSGQLASALRYKHIVGVIGPNGNHFKYINVNERDFTALIDVQLFNSKNHIDLSESTLIYDYNVVKTIELPLFRGNQRYGILRVLYLKRID